MRDPPTAPLPLFFFSETAFQVLQSGMDSLGEQERNAYVSDFKGFVTYVRDKGFQTYADKVFFFSPHFGQKQAGLYEYRPRPSFKTFVARLGRMIADPHFTI